MDPALRAALEQQGKARLHFIIPGSWKPKPKAQQRDEKVVARDAAPESSHLDVEARALAADFDKRNSLPDNKPNPIHLPHSIQEIANSFPKHNPFTSNPPPAPKSNHKEKGPCVMYASEKRNPLPDNKPNPIHLPHSIQEIANSFPKHNPFTSNPPPRPKSNHKEKGPCVMYASGKRNALPEAKPAPKVDIPPLKTPSQLWNSMPKLHDPFTNIPPPGPKLNHKGQGHCVLKTADKGTCVEWANP